MSKNKKNKPEIPMTEEKNIQESESTEVAVIQANEEASKTPNNELETIKMQIELEKAQIELEQLRAEKRSLSSRIISPEEQEIIDRQIARTNENKAVREKVRLQKEYDNVKVTGKFLNRRAPGQMAKLTYIKYEDDPVKWYEFYDGNVYTIPQGFADQINEYYHTPIFVQKDGPIDDPDNPGSQIAEVDKRNKKYAFVGLAYS